LKRPKAATTPAEPQLARQLFQKPDNQCADGAAGRHLLAHHRSHFQIEGEQCRQGNEQAAEGGCLVKPEPQLLETQQVVGDQQQQTRQQIGGQPEEHKAKVCNLRPQTSPQIVHPRPGGPAVKRLISGAEGQQREQDKETCYTHCHPLQFFYQFFFAGFVHCRLLFFYTLLKSMLIQEG